MKIKLFITNSFTSWEIESPLTIINTTTLTSREKDDAEWFRTKMIDIYKEFDTGKISAKYDFEIKK